MDETVSFPVILGENGDNEGLLNFRFDGEVITIELDGDTLCRMDWHDNLKKGFERMLKIWGLI